MWFVPRLEGDEYPAKRLEWLENYAPELLEEYLRHPWKLIKHLNKIDQRAMQAIYSMVEEQGMLIFEAEEIALTDIVYPEVMDPDKPRPPLSPKAQHRLQHFMEKHLGY